MAYFILGGKNAPHLPSFQWTRKHDFNIVSCFNSWFTCLIFNQEPSVFLTFPINCLNITIQSDKWLCYHVDLIQHDNCNLCWFCIPLYCYGFFFPLAAQIRETTCQQNIAGLLHYMKYMYMWVIFSSCTCVFPMFTSITTQLSYKHETSTNLLK